MLYKVIIIINKTNKSAIIISNKIILIQTNTNNIIIINFNKYK
jgi:hypothetical protein